MSDFYAGWDDDDDPGNDEELAARVAQIRQDREHRVAHDDWTYRDRPPPVKRRLTGAEALAQLAEQRDTALTPIMRKIQAQEEQRAYMEDEGNRALDWLGSHATVHRGP